MSESNKSLLDRLLGGAKNRTQNNQSKLEEQMKERLKPLVYEDELVDELAPIFAKLQGQEGFEKVFEVLETKEKQIEYISGGDWFKKETDDTNVDRSEIQKGIDKTDETLKSVTDILSGKYGEENNG